VLLQSLAAEAERRAREEDERRARKATLARTRAQASAARSGTPEPPSGRRHMDIQTETFLEVLSDRPPEVEAAAQTDALLDRPPTPLFVPTVSGVDAVTQVEAGELFDFDYEVAPLLDVLVGKTLEAALLEVAQEAELAAIRARQAEFEAVRSAEAAEVQRLEAEVRRRAAEKERRVAQERARVQREADVRSKVAAAAFARTCVGAMRGAAFDRLREGGFFYEPLRREIQTQLLPAVYEGVARSLTVRQEAAAVVLDDLLAAALAAAKARYADVLDARRAAAEAEAEQVRAAAAAAAAAVAAAAAASLEGGEEGAAEGEGEPADGEADGEEE
jgi:hypothetical protein